MCYMNVRCASGRTNIDMTTFDTFAQLTPISGGVDDVEKTYDREDNFTYHVRACEFQETGVVPPAIQTGLGHSVSSETFGEFNFHTLFIADDNSKMDTKLD